MVVNLLLVIISLAIILFGFGIKSFISIVGITLISFYVAKRLDTKHKKLIFILSISFMAGFLFTMKLLPFAYNDESNVQKYVAPFGLTFYMMQVISYLVDVYREEINPETNLIKYALYTTYVPHLFAGPVYSYDEALEGIIRSKTFSWQNVVDGLMKIAWGAFKLLVIGNKLEIFTTNITTLTTGGMYVVFAILLYAIQMFTTFSGTIDIALGISKIFDIELPENFNSPFLAESIFEFWERWQVTIVTWVQKYIFNSSKKKKVTKGRQVFNVLFAYFMIGFLMGTEYIIWAVINGILTLFEDRFKTSFKILNRILTYIILSITCTFILWPGFNGIGMLVSIFTKNNGLTAFRSIFNLGLSVSDFIILGCSFIALFIVDNNLERIRRHLNANSMAVQAVLIVVLGIIIFFAGVR